MKTDKEYKEKTAPFEPESDSDNHVEGALERINQNEMKINELLNDNSFPQGLREAILKTREDFELEKLEHERFMEANKGKKIIRYDLETFMPIFEE
jgi:hypothetical protein